MSGNSFGAQWGTKPLQTTENLLVIGCHAAEWPDGGERLERAPVSAILYIAGRGFNGLVGVGSVVATGLMVNPPLPSGAWREL